MKLFIMANLSMLNVVKINCLFVIMAVLTRPEPTAAINDLSPSDEHFDHQHSYHYASSHPSGVGSKSASSNHWFYKSNNNHLSVGSDGLPSAMTQIDRFSSTGRLSDSPGLTRGRFPFAYHKKYSRKPSQVMSIPDIPDIPPLPALPPLRLHYPSHQREADFDYWHKNNYNPIEYPSEQLFNDYRHGSKPLRTHDSHNHKNWHYSHNSGHSYHRSWDSSDPSGDHKFWSTDSYSVPQFSRNRPLKREKFSHRSSSDEDPYKRSLDDSPLKNNGFYKEMHFRWSFEESKPWDSGHNLHHF